jgi:hypothetical protein
MAVDILAAKGDTGKRRRENGGRRRHRSTGV